MRQRKNFIETTGITADKNSWRSRGTHDIVYMKSTHFKMRDTQSSMLFYRILSMTWLPITAAAAFCKFGNCFYNTEKD